MLQNCVRNRIPCRYVLNDVWFASAENMSDVKLKLDKEFIMALKTNRKVALCQPDKLHGRYHRLNQLDLPENTVTVIYLEQVSFPLYLRRQTCTNADGSTAVRYLVTSDSALTADQLITIYHKRWQVEGVSSLSEAERIPRQITDPHTNHPDQSFRGCSLDLHQAGVAQGAHQQEPLCAQDPLVSLCAATGFRGLVSVGTSAS